ncbi:MAG TPA: hypothetical protein VF702_11655 [Allosphingosinicella sp.]|jgi:hypothetical protein
MNRRVFVSVCTGLPFLACTFVPFTLFGLLYGQWGTNLFWGPVFGFGWWAAQTIGGPENFRAAAAFGIFVWVPIVLGGLFVLSHWVFRTGSDGARRLSIMLLLASCLPVVSADTALGLYANARVPPDFNTLVASW